MNLKIEKKKEAKARGR